MTLGSLIPSTLQGPTSRSIVQTYTYDANNLIQIWDKLPGAKLVVIYVNGAGGGGGGGLTNATVNRRSGGGGGGGGAMNWTVLSASSIPDRLFVIVGKGGVGGAANLVGTAGENSIVRSIALSTQSLTSSSIRDLGNLVLAGGGGGGREPAINTNSVGGGGGGWHGAGITGTASSISSGGGPGFQLQYAIYGGGGLGNNFTLSAGTAEFGGGGGGGRNSTGVGPSHGGSSLYGSGGGGVGGFLTDGTPTVALAPMSGGASGIYVDGSVNQSTRGGGVAPGGNGPDAQNLYGGAGGGAGGAANVSGAGSNGGNGGFPGGGGGGGGAGSTAGGSGGNGGHGRVIIITYF